MTTKYLDKNKTLEHNNNKYSLKSPIDIIVLIQYLVISDIQASAFIYDFLYGHFFKTIIHYFLLFIANSCHACQIVKGFGSHRSVSI